MLRDCCSIKIVAGIALLVTTFSLSSVSAKVRPIKDFGTEHQVYILLGDADRLMEQGRYMDAKATLQRAASFDPTANSGIVHQRLSQVYAHFGSYQQSIVEGLISLKFNPDLKSSALDIAVGYKELGRPDEAIAWAQKYLDMRPDKIWRQRGEDLIRDIQTQKERESKCDPHSPDYLEQFGDSDGAHPWPKEKMPIKFCIRDGRRVPGYQPVFQARTLEAMNAWVQASNGRISYVLTPNADEADLVISWQAEPLKRDEKQKFQETAGLTHYPATTNEENWQILKSTIDVKTTGNGEKRYVTDQEVKAVVLHELGHALGLTGHSTNVNDIMYYSESSRNLAALSKRDRATIARLYADYPQLFPPSP